MRVIHARRERCTHGRALELGVEKKKCFVFVELGDKNE